MNTLAISDMQKEGILQFSKKLRVLFHLKLSVTCQMKVRLYIPYFSQICEQIMSLKEMKVLKLCLKSKRREKND